MQPHERILQIFRSTGALLEGHFILTSGRHSATYFQCATVLQYPEYLTLFGNFITDQFEGLDIDIVISLAVGGIVIGTEVGRQLGVKSIFAERERGKMTLRRGFEMRKGAKVLVIEDVITTGGSVKEVMEVVNQKEGEIVGVGVVVDRSNGTIKLHKNQFAIIQLIAESYAPEDIPEELLKIPVVKPGSRNLP